MLAQCLNETVILGMSTILVIEDDKHTANAVSAMLLREGHLVTIASDGHEGLTKFSLIQPEIIVLDLMLPGVDGYTLVAAFRRAAATVSILILSARDGIDDRIHGLNIGADDYLVKPFSMSELLARIRAVARRGQPPAYTIQVGTLLVDRVKRVASRSGRVLRIAPMEFDLLFFLAENSGRDVARSSIAQQVWHITERATPINNVIDVHIARLRRELDPPTLDPMLITVRGVGYRLIKILV